MLIQAIKQFNFDGNLDNGSNTTMLLIIYEVKQTVSNFSQKNMRICKFLLL